MAPDALERVANYVNFTIRYYRELSIENADIIVKNKFTTTPI